MMSLEETAERLVLLQRWQDRSGVHTAGMQAKLVKELSPDQLQEVLKIVLAKLGPAPALSGQSVPVIVRGQ